MDSSCRKLYHVHGMDSRMYLDTYFSDKPEMVFGDESMKYPMEKLHHIFSKGHITGEIVTDISVGPFIHQLYSACEFFKEIYVLKCTEECTMELNRWLNTRTGAYDWNHTSSYATELEGNCGQHEEKEIRLKSAIKLIVKCDLEKENITDPVKIPLADCVISAMLLEITSIDENSYIRNIKKMIGLLKPMGNLILGAIVNATYFTIGPDRYNVFKCDEEYTKKILINEGFTIDYCDVLRRKSVSDLIDHEGVMIMVAHREK